MDTTPPAAFWVFLLLGAALVVIAYVIYHGRRRRGGRGHEGFETAPAATTTPAAAPAASGTTSGTAATPVAAAATGSNLYIEPRSGIPQAGSLVFYLTSFSADREGTVAPATVAASGMFSAAMGRWSNWVTTAATGALPANEFHFSLSPLSGVLPTAIYQAGLPMRNVRMFGPSSMKLAASGSFPPTVGPFSLVFYAKLRGLRFDTPAPMTLWKVHLENPDTIALTLLPIEGDPDNARVRIQLGRATVLYEWVIPAANLLGGGPPVAYTLVYDPATSERGPVARFYLGTTAYTAELQAGAANILGNSAIEVNSDGRLDATLLAMMYYNRSLSESDVTAVATYLGAQHSGLPAAMALQQIRAKTEIQALADQVRAGANQAADLRRDLDKCRAALTEAQKAAAATAPKADAKLHWQIQSPNGGATGFIDPETLKKCTPLVIHAYGQTGNAPAATKKAAAAAAAAATKKPDGPALVVAPSSGPVDSVWGQMKDWLRV